MNITGPPTSVSSRALHDGMNLVAKEFIAARDDEQGVLILSQFTGAAQSCRKRWSSIPISINARRPCTWRCR